jgi:serine/threonine protein kinase
MASRPTRIGKYSVEGIIGRGGMGVVYKAIDPQIGRYVAIKMINAGVDESLLERFKSEARSTGSLQCPNIVTVYDFGEQDGNPYLVMQYLEGSSLESLIQKGLSLTLSERLSIIIDICKGLAYAHQRDIIHRDIKPGNIMVLRDGVNDGMAVIVDFGIARIGSDTRLTRTDQLIGSVHYMSPEQLRAEKLDNRIDIYAAGVVLFRLLTGALPFDAPDTAATLLKIINEPPPPLSAYLKEYPVELDGIVSRVLAKKREERYATAKDLALDLVQVQEHLKSGPLQYSVVPPAIELAPVAPEPQRSATCAFASVFEKSTVRAVPTSPPVLSQPASGQGELTNAFRAPSTKILASDAAAASEEPARKAGITSDFTRFFSPAAPDKETGQTFPQVRLTFTSGSDDLLFGKSVVVSSVPFRIGRNADLNIADAHLSREHAVIDWDGKAFTISDLGSKNGTYLNGRQLRTDSQTLPFGAVIRLGAATVLTFSSDEISELPDVTGQTIASRYQLTKLLRNGTKTALYEATDSHLPHMVAVKILSPSLAGYTGYLEHFNREAEMAVRLRHPHIRRVLDYGQTTVRIGARPSVAVNYLSMELMEGGSLTDRVAQGTLFELSEVISWLNDISNALESAHRQGVTHGGLKLSSIVFDREGEPYVTDFAMARRLDDQSRLVFIGSPEFLAPEQWGGFAATHLADEYALAVLTYLLLAGSLPFEGQIDPKVRERNFLRGPIPVHEEAARLSRPTVPSSVSNVLKRALSVEPANRYSSVREFFLALQYAVSNQANRSEGPARIFISYQRDLSSGWAAHFASELDRKHHIAAFVDTQRMDSAVRFPARLKKAIQDCDVFVCLLSGTTLESKWVQEEIRLAWENNKPMVPVFQESYSQPDPSERLEPHIEALINYEGVKLFDRQNVYVENAIERLARMVTESVNKSVRSRAE